MIRVSSVVLAFALASQYILVNAAVAGASSFAGSTSTAAFPPPNAPSGTAVFLDGSAVGFAGPTPTGDEANAIATAPAAAKFDSTFPLIHPPAADANKPFSAPFDVLQHLGNLSPFQSVDSASFGLPGASSVVPKGCSLKQVHMMHRHGARYPTADAGTATFAAGIHASATNKTAGFGATGPLSFLNTWTYKLGAEILTPFGRSELFNLGVGFRVKYGELLKGFKKLPVFRTTSEARMLDSALHFHAGFFGVQAYQSSYHQLITIENDGVNNTMAPYFSCPNGDNAIYTFGFDQANKWANIYLKPAVKRLQGLVKGHTLTVTDMVAMQQMCAYETVALGYSAFCDLFTEEEWKGFEYFVDLTFWYGSGPGNPAASAQGIGYVYELVSRLTSTPIATFNSAVNSTIVTDSELFPLDQPIYVDVSHDTVMTTIFAAMNFTTLGASGPLPLDHIPSFYTYKVNQIAPFATNLVGQVLSCPASASSSSSGEATHIRWILNDGVLPLTGIKGCKANKDGLCDLKTFVAGMKQRIAEVDYTYDCFANYTVPSPDLIVDGQYPKNLRK